MFCVSIIPVSLDVLNHFAQKEITDERQRVKERERESERTGEGEERERDETVRVRSNGLKSLAAALGSR